MTRRRSVSLSVLAVVVVVGVALGLAWNWSWFRGPIAHAASDALGRKVTLAGDISVDLGLTTRVTLNDITIANTAWGKAGDFARAGRIEASIRLLPLFSGKVDIPRLVLAHPRIALERNADGAANWTFGNEKKNAAGKQGALPRIGKLRVEDGKLSYDDRKTGDAFGVQIVEAEATPGNDNAGMTVDGKGVFHGQPFDVSLKAGSLYEAGDAGDAFPVDLSGHAGGSTVAVKGTLGAPFSFHKMDLGLDLRGPDIAGLAALAGVDLPHTRAYVLKTHVVHDGNAWSFDDIAARLGQSDLEGVLHFRPAGPDATRPKLTGRLVSKSLDFNDFAAFADTGDGGEKTKAPATANAGTGTVAKGTGSQRAAAKDATQQRVIPDVALDFPVLRAIDADLNLKADRIANTPGHIDSLTAHVQLEAGKLSLEKVRLTAAGSRFLGSASLDSGATPTAATFSAKMDNLDLALILPKDASRDLSGKLGGHVHLSGQGKSLHTLLDSLKGRVTAFLSGGHLNEFLARVAGLDVLGTIGSLMDQKNATTQIKCMVADFGVKKGVLKSDALVLDTNSMLLTGDGTISLPKEKLDLTLTPRAQGISPLSFSTPLLVSGSFRNPSVGPEPAGVGLEAGKTIALGLFLGPMAALVPMIENRLEGDGNCGQLLKDVRSSDQTKTPPASGKAGQEAPKAPAPKAPAPKAPAPKSSVPKSQPETK